MDGYDFNLARIGFWGLVCVAASHVCVGYERDWTPKIFKVSRVGVGHPASPVHMILGFLFKIRVWQRSILER
jgi:hypothetical protein